MSSDSSIKASILAASCILCRQKGYGCKCGGAAGEMTPEAAKVFWAQLPQRSAARQEQDKQEIEARGWKPTAQFKNQQCDWCKGKDVPSHRPYNCRDRANRASRFYEAPSAEQEHEDKKAKPFLFGDGMFGAPPKMELDFVNGFMGSHEYRAPSTPFTFTPPPPAAPFQHNTPFRFASSPIAPPPIVPFTFTPAPPLVSAFPPGGCRPNMQFRTF